MAAPTKSSNQTYYTNHALITLDALQHCGEFEYFFLLFGFDQKLCNVKCVKNLSRKSFVTFETKMTHSKKSTFKYLYLCFYIYRERSPVLREKTLV